MVQAWTAAAKAAQAAVTKVSGYGIKAEAVETNGTNDDPGRALLASIQTAAHAHSCNIYG